MLVPEKPRAGELDRAECGHCRPSEHTIWADDAVAGPGRLGPHGHPVRRWHRAARARTASRTRRSSVLTTLGPLLQRVSAAVKSIPGVARCHFARWGDGSEHFHLWALARPAGMMQGRGAILAFWDAVLPSMSEEMKAEHLRIVAESLAAGGGTAFPQR